MSHLTLVLGGARSGKSRYAESLITRHPPPWTYLATAQPGDAEMAARIDLHRARRGAGWRTVELPLDLSLALALADPAPLLLDCLTLWLTNVMLADLAIKAQADALLVALALRAAPCVVVSTEVGLGIVPDNALARRFRDEAGHLHQRVAEAAGHVVFMAAGLPMTLKGSP